MKKDAEAIERCKSDDKARKRSDRGGVDPEMRGRKQADLSREMASRVVRHLDRRRSQKRGAAAAAAAGRRSREEKRSPSPSLSSRSRRHDKNR